MAFLGVAMSVNTHFQLSSFVSQFSSLGFSGSRHPHSSATLGASSAVSLLGGFSGSVVVGCARGVDHIVRSKFPLAHVFRVQPPISRGSFAQRSARLVQHLASQPSPLLLAFPLGACPAAVAPSLSFVGHGSGSWGSIAMALGLGVPVLVFVPSSTVGFPAPPALACRFVSVGTACGGAWWLAR